ncbi:TM1266 family iron-only hydrogenase system putative regulator [Anaerosacchariphilus polymeriproducens]|uniref:Iron-only hydrogenase system regulator n=1 Tax=Anaerosacchariphilus polymeriproducens TaxID=1812858 RepID=A0A371AZT2_9FIRM|nr:TM1266 family iron-only hydrogenase system putative regulator [Anaerosacchariphilus polymeriproducens]RDU25095.1 iron-only hydrogenase system regulator [Anaerosacchariphilus polymeriproducens]
METRVALIGIIVENLECVKELNDILHEYCQFIIGRMGLPYSKRDISIISVAIDAPNSTINALSGKIGKLQGVSVRTIYSKVG